MNTAVREAFDLHNRACRFQFKRDLPRRWKQATWWKLVIQDTRDRVCSKPLKYLTRVS